MSRWQGLALLALIVCSTQFGTRLQAQVSGNIEAGQAVIGTEGEDFAMGVAIDKFGETFVTGSIGQGTQPLPVTPGAYQGSNTEFGGAYAAKLLPDGSLKIFSVIAPNSRGEAIAVDDAGEIVVAGVTRDPQFHVTPGAVDAGPSSQPRAFVAKLSADGSQLLYAAILGPIVPNPDVIAPSLATPAGPSLRVGVDYLGNALVAGTAAPGYPTTPGAIDTTFAGASEAFVTKVSADGTALLYSTYLGGAGVDEGHGLSVDSAGDALVSGTTESTDFPATTILQAGQGSSAFVAEISPDGSSLDFSTLVGGNGPTLGRGVVYGNEGYIYLTGVTRATDFPATGARFDYPWRIPRYESFVMRLFPGASGIVFSTSLLRPDPLIDDRTGGERGSDMAISLAVDPLGKVHVVGATDWHDVQSGILSAFEAVVAGDGSSFTSNVIGYGMQPGSVALDIATYLANGNTATAISTNNAPDVSGVQPTYGKDPFINYNTPDWEGLPNGMYTDGMITWSVNRPAENTPAGGPVTLASEDGGASVSFGAVSADGNTTLTPIDPNAIGVPNGFRFAGAAYEIHTTAAVTGIQVCLTAPGSSDADFQAAVILHGVNGVWQVEPSTADLATRTRCATVASLSPFAIAIPVDTTPPTIAVASPANRRYLVNEAVTASYTCADDLSGVASCTGSTPTGGAVDTSRAGAKTFTVQARNGAGLEASAAAAYSVGYNVRVLFPAALSVKRNDVVGIALQLVDASQKDVSDPSVVLKATGLRQVTTGRAVPVMDSDWLNPDNTFRFAAHSYVYAIGTKRLARGTYELSFTAGADPLVHAVSFTVR